MKSRIFLFLLIFILIFPCSCFNKGNGTVNIDDKCICINTGVFVDHAIDYQLYLNDSLLVFGETQNRIADTFKCTPFKMHGDKRSLRIVSKYAQIDSLLYISEDNRNLYISIQPDPYDLANMEMRVDFLLSIW
jgi:hypothetical protein